MTFRAFAHLKPKVFAPLLSGVVALIPLSIIFGKFLLIGKFFDFHVYVILPVLSASLAGYVYAYRLVIPNPERSNLAAGLMGLLTTVIAHGILAILILISFISLNVLTRGNQMMGLELVPTAFFFSLLAMGLITGPLGVILGITLNWISKSPPIGVK